ncbi:hypothetical protein [Parabacteroides sp. AM08-6]|uniref:hypothetical protein n=1 Tax=Parabacteroides sp. AM08-6 TaxID=2292053 RepID=UPI000EFEFD62|nr:hypothetical protein [Parabacteroides sp. AM08-6]RHJ77002.1 hypothetical protein DW103_16340 [Parabacteroides sp. AM08-6]
MKHILFISYAICTFTLAACSNEIIPSDKQGDNAQLYWMEEDTSVIFVNSIEDLCKDLTISNYENPFLSTKANVIIQTVKGYDELSYKYKDSKMSFGANLAAIIGVDPYVVYIVDEYLLTKRISMSDGYAIPLESPKCGFLPTGKNNELGYSATVINGNFEMTTITINVKYNTSGQTLNIWSPRQNSQIEWIYGSL